MEKSSKVIPAPFTTGKLAASVTSTSVSPQTKNERLLWDDMEILFSKITKKGYVKVYTTLGDLVLELFCDQVSCCFAKILPFNNVS